MDALSHSDRVLRDNFENVDRKRRMSRIVSILLIVILALTVVLAMVSVGYFIIFRVKSVNVSGSAKYQNSAVTEACEARYTGMSMFRISYSDMVSQLQLNYPYLKTVDIKKVWPSSLEITVTDDSGAYYTEISDQYFVLSHELRVLERVDEESMLDYRGLCHVTLPPVKYAVTGSYVRFMRESDFDNVYSVCRTLYQSKMSMLISSINMNDKFDMFFIYNNQYRIEFGKNEDLETKLELVMKIIDTFSDDFSSDRLKGTVNVSDITLGFVIFDSKVKLSGRK
ncbi:MAG: FtsQ-type POTRA domain-containing protein [Clostridiales bacterium]|nr:FtsQ-type POTRA domain-containing protein [Clostridiales bacterium]